ncbi:hypothetical protein NDU88_002084 [Pleurodeles waltl]|uniref:Uncharacterized protein n=1 Tax=Pleurodeles waltl TaxID=8319 RepID=A0AAV7LEQ3_PLEWA|nr:hypothetical protein NDU88_002084 [Pleurodeles waltl]
MLWEHRLTVCNAGPGGEEEDRLPDQRRSELRCGSAMAARVAGCMGRLPRCGLSRSCCSWKVPPWPSCAVGLSERQSVL